MPNINLANLNIALRDFQAISSGKYNAGEITLTSDHSLGKVNDHVHTRGDNDTPLAHSEILAVKTAFVKALQQNGIGADEINRVRTELGLAPDGATDTSLASRSIRPLTRQKVREILDRNAETLTQNNPDLEIVTYEASHARFTDREREDIARTRNEVNSKLMKQRKLLPDMRIVDVQNVIAGNIAFSTQAQRVRLLAVVESQKAFILEHSPNGRPSEEPNASLNYPIPENGLNLTFQLGMSMADYVRKLDSMLTFLKGDHMPNDATFAVRDEFRRASTGGPQAVAKWVAGLAMDPNGAFKARTVAVGLLFDAGIDDFETLSLVNRISDFAAIALVSHLANRNDALRGDALRQSAAITSLAAQVEPEGAVPPERKAFIPVLSQDEVNRNMSEVLKGLTLCTPTHETDVIQVEVKREFEARFGAGVFKANATFSSIAPQGAVQRAFNALGPGRHTVEEIKNAIIEQALPDVAKKFLMGAITPMIRAANGNTLNAMGIVNALFARHPQLKERFLAVATPEQANAAVNEFQNEINEAIRRSKTVERCHEQAKVWYRERIADALGVPVSALESRGSLNVTRLGVKAENLGIDICSGANNADTDEQIERAFRGLVNASADVRINLLHQVDNLAPEILDDARDILKHQILTLDKVSGFNLANLKLKADDIPVKGILTAIESGAPSGDILRLMGAAGQMIRTAAISVYQGQIVGTDEISAATNLIVTLALARHPEGINLMRVFFARNEVAGIDFVNLEANAARAVAFQLFRPQIPVAESNAELADAIGKPGLASLHAQALKLAMDDLGIGDLPDDEKAKLTAPDGNVAKTIANYVRAATQQVTPSQLRGIARMAMAEEAAHIATRRYIESFATDNGIANSADFDGYVKDVILNRNPALLRTLANTLSGVAARGENIAAAARDIMAAHNATILKALQAFDAIRRTNAGAATRAATEIAERTHLDLAFVSQKLKCSGLLVERGGSLNILRSIIRDRLSDPATDINAFDIAAVEAQARNRVDTFIVQKSAFISEMLRMPGSDALRGSLVTEALTYPPYKDYELAAAAVRIMNRPEIRAALDYAKNILTADKVSQLSDEDVFNVFETLGSHFNAAIQDELPEEKRASMDNDDHAVIRSLLISAFADHCGQTLLDAAARLAADGRLDTLDEAGNAARRRYDDEYMTYASGIDSKGNRVEIDEARASAANKGAADVSLGQRLLTSLTDILHDEWIPAEMADAIRQTNGTHEQALLAAAAIKRAPGLITSIGAGLDPDKFARFKSFAITLDYRTPALATTKELLLAAADALRKAPDVEHAEARLAELTGLTFKSQDADAAIAAAAQAAGIALNPARAAAAAKLLADFGPGMPVKNARVLARFIVNLKLTEESADADRRRVEAIAPQIAGWRDFGLTDPPAGKAEFADFFKLEANALFANYNKPQNATKFTGDHFSTMIADIPRSIYIVGGNTYAMKPVNEVLPEFDKVVTSPKARRAISILMSQTSVSVLSQLQAQNPVPGNDLRPQRLDTTTLPGAGAYVSRSSTMPPDLFMSPILVLDPATANELSVSPDGRTATVKLYTIGKLLVGTEGDTMDKHFGSVVVEREYTIDLTAEDPVVTDVHVSQTFSDTTDLGMDGFVNSAVPFPPPEIPLPPPNVPGEVPNIAAGPNPGVIDINAV